jgi:hypothetical protein
MGVRWLMLLAQATTFLLICAALAGLVVWLVLRSRGGA